VRVVLQRVTSASVSIDGQQVGAIGRGFCLLVGFTHDDTPDHCRWMAEKIVGLRLFNDSDGKMNLALGDVAGSVLVVSQFTLYGDSRKGRRPSFVAAADPEVAVPLYQAFIEEVRQRNVEVASGRFGAMMEVALVNDGPVTLTLER